MKKKEKIILIVIGILIGAAAQSIIMFSIRKIKNYETKANENCETKINKVYINSKGVEIPEEEYQNLLPFFNEESINTMSQDLFDALYQFRKGNVDIEFDENEIPILSSKDSNNREYLEAPKNEDK